MKLLLDPAAFQVGGSDDARPRSLQLGDAVVQLVEPTQRTTTPCTFIPVPDRPDVQVVADSPRGLVHCHTPASGSEKSSTMMHAPVKVSVSPENGVLASSADLRVLDARRARGQIPRVGGRWNRDRARSSASEEDREMRSETCAKPSPGRLSWR